MYILTACFEDRTCEWEYDDYNFARSVCEEIKEYWDNAKALYIVDSNTKELRYYETL